ncbi:hypothetical protein BC332_29193 [Capsicum chinense]|nr:hypothetical protein BC332_29193 [Capsicum chinense]
MEIGLAVGGAFLSSALNVLFDRLAPNGDLLKMFQKNKHDVRLLKKLKMTLDGLQAVLSDAENKQASNQHVSQWLNELRDAVDGAENLMEEVNYKALRLKVEGQLQNLVGSSNLSLSDDFFLNIKEKLEDTIETLEDLQKKIGLLGLQKYLDSGKKIETRTPATSVVESDVFGRQNEIERLIDRLTSKEATEKNMTAVPIVGMGGVGKTTLAQAVYNDKKVTNHFGLKAWICVSETYDAFEISKGLLQAFDSFDLKDDSNLNQLQVKLKESLKGKRFLIVLDDMWNENYIQWNKLWSIFIQGGIGSQIIVTTRKESVALMMGSWAINVGILSSEASWALFKRHSLENRDPPKEHPELEEDGKQIADKCKGLPLALKALAGSLRCKSEVDEWTDVLRSEMWDSNDILPALMLSYNELPAHLKQCFAFCAIYPKDYHFCKEQVIHLWIASGLGLCCPKLSKRVLYNILPSLRSLRALSLSGYGIVEMPNDLFIKLKLLRFLDLSRTKITKLPDSICALYNLETLLLSSCGDLEELSLQMEKLINLRHLDISNTSRLKMPLHLRKLKSLQVIVGAKFVLGRWRMEELGQLRNLYGSLSILELQNVVDKKEALKAKMREKEHVENQFMESQRKIMNGQKHAIVIVVEIMGDSYVEGENNGEFGRGANEEEEVVAAAAKRKGCGGGLMVMV